MPPRQLTLAGYDAALRQARALALSGAGSAALRGRIAAALPLQAAVRMPSGVVVRVDNRPLLRLLPHSPAPAGTRARRLRRPWRFIAALDQLQAALAMPSAGAGGAAAAPLDRMAAERVLREVLSRPEFQYKEPTPTLIDRFLNWLGDLITRFFLWLGRLMSRLLPASERTPGRADQLARLMIIGVVLLLAVLIARIILVILPNLRRRRAATAERPSGELLVPQEPEALLAAAEREAAAGRYREALRLAYEATVARLDRAGILPEDRSRTHWELLRDLGRGEGSGVRGQGSVEAQESSALTPDPRPLTPRPSPSSFLAVLVPLTQRLDERLYGGRATTLEDYQLCRSAHDQIERLLCAPA